MITKFTRDDRGATAIEYGLIAAIIALGIFTAIGAVINKSNGIFSFISDSLPVETSETPENPPS
ncbi:Flp family type IVb pilin [Asticcacaulis sp. SL142]|uniref:Flp family type IVb pilin n=1 Tax=Asticcacaulis sp. SL142 TaxID=2995155 RepID=UPI00226CC1F2|nr:Flp family type IVb pilin [Asticcacaulis sp. SL142]WAC47698.1 Flp family type IVb pilin [Asticcacaulis sp. SL142]